MKKWIALLLIIVFIASSPAAYAAAMLSDTGADSKTTSSAPASNSVDKAKSYAEAERLLASGDTARAAMAFGRAIGYKDAKERSFALWREIQQGNQVIAAGEYHTVGLREDGTVVAVGTNNSGSGECNVSDWKNIVAIAAGGNHTLGLKADGSVLATGLNNDGQCNVSSWNDIIAISAGDRHSIGLRFDGTVVAVGNQHDRRCDVKDWRNIVAISAGWNHTVGLCADGAVVATGNNEFGQCDVSDWSNIVAITAGDSCTIGLCIDGSAVAVGCDGVSQCEVKCDVSDWVDIVNIAAGFWHTVGLRADGTVIAAGYDHNTGAVGRDPYEANGWTDIVAIAAGLLHTVGLRADGTVLAVGNNTYGQCDVSDWTNIKLPNFRPVPASSASTPATSTPNPDGSFNYSILQNEPGYLYDKFDDYWTWYAAYDEPYLDADLIIGIQLEGEMGGTDLAGVTLYTKIMDKNGRSIDGVSSMVFLIDGVKYSYNEMAEEDGAMAGAVVLYDSGYELIKAFASANEVSVKLNLFSGNTVRLDLNPTEFNNTLKYISRKIIDYRLWDYYIENPALGIIELMFPLEITQK